MTSLPYNPAVFSSLPIRTDASLKAKGSNSNIETKKHNSPPGHWGHQLHSLHTFQPSSTPHHLPPQQPLHNSWPSEERANEDQEEKGCWSGCHQLQAAEGLCGPALWGSSAHHLNLGVERVPVPWKTFCVVQLPKTVQAMEPNHFRPIALTSHLVMTMERTDPWWEQTWTPWMTQSSTCFTEHYPTWKIL